MVDGKAMRRPSDSLEGLGSVIWVIVGSAGSTGLAILVILFVVLNRNRKKLNGTRGYPMISMAIDVSRKTARCQISYSRYHEVEVSLPTF